MRHDNPNRKDDYLMSSHQNTKYADGEWFCVCSSDPKSPKFLDGRLWRAKIFQTKCVNFCDIFVKSTWTVNAKSAQAHILFFFVHFLLIVTQTIWQLSWPFGNFTQHPKTFQHDFKGDTQKLSGYAKSFQVEYQPVTQVFGRLVWSPDHLYGKSSRTYFCILYSEK